MLFWLILCAACLLIYWLISTLGTLPSWRTICIFNKLPGPTGLPFFIGASWDLMKIKDEELLPYYKDKLEQFGGVCAVYTWGNPWLWVSDPDVIGVILKDNINIQKGPEYRFTQRLMQDGLLVSVGDKWRQRRKMLTPCFNFGILHAGEQCINRHWKKMVNGLLDFKGPLQPLMYVALGSFNIINEIAMGVVLDDHHTSGKEYGEYAKRALKVTSKRVTQTWLKTDFIFDLTPGSKSYMNDIRFLLNFTKNIIKQRREKLVKKKLYEESQNSDYGKKHRAFLDLLIEISPEERLEDSDMVEEVNTFMYVGQHTTSIAGNYLIKCLAENQDVQEKAYQEQLEIFGFSDRDVEHEDLPKMHYLDQVIKESLRLYPPFPQISRLLVTDVMLPNGQVVPAGTKVSLNLFLTHRNPKYWEDPEAFNPGRFDFHESNRRHPFSYVPFSAGSRNCIAQKLAFLELKIMASVLLRSCKLTAEPQSEAPKYMMLITLQTAIPVRINLSPRTGSQLNSFPEMI